MAHVVPVVPPAMVTEEGVGNLHSSGNRSTCDYCHSHMGHCSTEGRHECMSNVELCNAGNSTPDRSLALEIGKISLLATELELHCIGLMSEWSQSSVYSEDDVGCF